jgi:hypothetical protein
MEPYAPIRCNRFGPHVRLEPVSAGLHESDLLTLRDMSDLDAALRATLGL